jgi:hypothetical protein
MRDVGTGPLSRRQARLGWCAIAAVIVGCTATTALPIAAASATAAQTQHTLSYYYNHPCALITSNQVKSVFGMPVGQGRTILPHADGGPGGGKCEYGTANEERTLSFLFEAGTAASEKAAIPGPYVNEPSVGHGAFCVAKGFSVGWFYANVGSYNGSPENLAIVDSNCTYSVKFARDAFARLF